jgi:hypothetical protein
MFVVVGGVRGCSLGAGLAVSISSGPCWNLDWAVWSMTLCVLTWAADPTSIPARNQILPRSNIHKQLCVSAKEEI